jgi:NlpC/P60 family putative phage cell wall peptidase
VTKRETIVREAREWIGTRYHHGASLKGTGTDCIGLIVGVAAVCGIAEASEFKRAEQFKAYGRQPDPVMLLRGCALWLDPVSVSQATLGDILLFKFNKEPQHFGLISGCDPRYVIHAYAQARRVVENRLDSVWMSRVMRAFSFRGIE